MTSLLDQLFRYPALQQIFSDTARIQSMLDFEAALARAASRSGILPATSAEIIAEQCRAEHFDLTAIARDAALAGNVAIPLIKQLTALAVQRDKEAARFVHWGATSQDVIDTGCVLQIRRAFDLIEEDLGRLAGILATLAEKHSGTVMVGRTWMQQALPTTFGFVVAGWLDAIVRQRTRIAETRTRVLALQFGGAVGTLAALGANGASVAKALAEELRLQLPARPWHTHRDRIAEVAVTLGICAGIQGKIARDISLLTQTEVAEVFEPAAGGRGGSSTLAHKRNPVTCAMVLSAAQRVPGLVTTILASMIQEGERGLGGWQAEWETLPELICLTGGALHHLADMVNALEIDAEQMQRNLEITRGLIFAEAVTMALADRMGKMPAHLLVEASCKKAREQKLHLKEVLLAEAGVHGHLSRADLESLFDPRNYLGSAQEFVRRVLAEAAEAVPVR